MKYTDHDEIMEELCHNPDVIAERLVTIQNAVNAFCDKQDWAVDGWKRQDHISQLFALRTDNLK